MHDESSQITKDMAGRDGRIGGNKAGRDKGFALIVVLWLGVLLALMAAGFASAVTSRLRATSADADLVRAEAFADAGARIALLDLMNAGSRNGSPPRFARDGTPLVCALEGEAVLVIQAEDEEGKVNLNLADERLLTALFAGLGSTDDEARHYADAIIDFRDADDDKRLNGAERDDYHGKGAGPKNAAFQSIDELDQVLGLTRRDSPIRQGLPHNTIERDRHRRECRFRDIEKPARQGFGRDCRRLQRGKSGHQ